MPKANFNDRRDLNEPALVHMLHRRGLIARRMGREAGFDLLVFDRQAGARHFVEVKNPLYAWSLTEAELDMIRLCAECRIPYFVVQHPADIDALIAGRWDGIDYTKRDGLE